MIIVNLNPLIILKDYFFKVHGNNVEISNWKKRDGGRITKEKNGRRSLMTETRFTTKKRKEESLNNSNKVEYERRKEEKYSWLNRCVNG